MLQMLPPEAYPDCPVSNLTTKFAHTGFNKTRCAVNCVTWTRDGRRAVTGDNIGQVIRFNSTDFAMLQPQQAAVLYCLQHLQLYCLVHGHLGVMWSWDKNFKPFLKVVAHQ
eukprot:gene593-877_t